MKILAVLPQLPDPPHSGGRIVTYNLFTRLARRHEVWVVSLIHDPSQEKDAERFRERVPWTWVFPAHAKWDLPVMARSLVGATPYKVHRFHNPEMEQHLRDLTSRERFDVIHCQNYYTAQYLRGDEDAARILYTENFETLILERFARTRRNPLKKALIMAEAARTRRYELDCCRKFHRILTISAIDCERFAEACPARDFRVQPAGVDLGHYTPRPAPPTTNRIVFTGTLSYYPNADAVLWFAREVLPRVRQQAPGAVFQIVGDAPGPEILALRQPGVIEVTGRVPDVRDYIAGAAVYAVPLRIGGGVRLKILEAMAMGAAIVSTAVGAEGLEVEAGRDLILADRPEDMAASIAALLRDREARAAYGAAARARVEADYNWDRVVEKLEHHYEEVLDER